jgi:hypothetical protein
MDPQMMRFLKLLKLGPQRHSYKSYNLSFEFKLKAHEEINIVRFIRSDIPFGL